MVQKSIFLRNHLYMHSESCFFYDDYFNVFSIMGGVSAVRDRQFHRTIASVPVRKVEKTVAITRPQMRQYIVPREKIETDNIQLMVQNNDKLITFLSCVKSHKGIESVMFVTDNCICVLVKSQNLHPVLVMKFPLSEMTVYARSNNLVYDLPLDDLFAHVSFSASSGRGYALYYKTTDGVTSLHYELENESACVPEVGERNTEYVNLILQPTVGNDLQKLAINTRNIDYMNSIQLLMLSKVASTAVFKDCNYSKSEESIEFQIQLNSTGLSTMQMIIHNVSHSSNRRPIVEESNAMIWKFKPNQVFKMTKRTLLLLMSVNNRIKVGTDSLYFAFGCFGSVYVFIKLITLKPILISDSSAPVINMGKLLEGTPHIFEMFYCS